MPPKELSHNEQALLNLCQENPEGITDSMIQQKVGIEYNCRHQYFDEYIDTHSDNNYNLQ